MFGKFLKELRQRAEISLRQLAKQLEIAPSYLSDIEREKRYAPTKKHLDKIISIFSLSEKEEEKLFDLAAEGKNKPIAEDVKEIFQNQPSLTSLCRIIKKKNLNTNNIIKDIEKKIDDVDNHST